MIYRVTMKKVIFVISALFLITACSKSSSPEGLNPGVPKKGELTKAASQGDLQLVEKLLSRGADLNENIGDGTDQITPLLAAIAQERTDVAKQLLMKGAKSYHSYKGYSAPDFVLHRQGDETDFYRLLLSTQQK